MANSNSHGRRPNWQRFSLGSVASILVLCFWAFKAVTQNRAPQQPLALCLLVTMGLMVVVISGYLTMTSAEKDAWRLVLHGMTLPGAIITALVQLSPSGPALMNGDDKGHQEGGESVLGWIDFDFWDSRAYAQTDVELTPPSTLKQAMQEVAEFFGHDGSNWYVEAGRTRNLEDAQKLAQHLRDLGFQPLIYILHFSEGPRPEWVAGSKPAAADSQYTVLLGRELSRNAATSLREEARKKSVSTTAWQSAPPDKTTSNQAPRRASEK